MNRIEQTRLDLVKKGKKIINLSSGNPNEHGIIFDKKILAKGRQASTTNPHYHPDPKGSIEARKAVQTFYRKRGLQLNPENIILTSGTSESYFHLFKLLAKPGEKILFPNPSYPLFEEIARLAEIDLSFYQLDEKRGWQIDAPDLEKKITKVTKAIVLISPSNPTGSVLHESTLKKIIGTAKKYHLPIISDEVFCEFIFDKEKFPRIASMTKEVDIFTLNGISKTYALPGLKLSWITVTGPRKEEYLEAIERSADAFLSCNQLAQNALPDIIKHGEKFLKSFQNYVQSNRDLAIQILQKNPQLSFHKPEGGFYLFLKITGLKNKNGQPITDEEFVIELLKKANIFAHPGYFYDYDKDVYLLISLLLPPQKLIKCLQKIIKLAQQLKANI